MSLLLTLNMLCFVALEFKERQELVYHVLYNINVKNITGHFRSVKEFFTNKVTYGRSANNKNSDSFRWIC